LRKRRFTRVRKRLLMSFFVVERRADAEEPWFVADNITEVAEPLFVAGRVHPEAEIATIGILLEHVRIDTLEMLLLGESGIMRERVLHSATKDIERLDMAVSLSHDTAIDAARRLFPRGTMVLDSLSHSLNLLVGEPLPQVLVLTDESA